MTAKRVKVRSCLLEEAPGVLDFWKEAASASPTDNLRALTAVFKEREDALLLATDAAQIVGTVIWGYDGWRGNIYRLAVHPDYRRQGIGRMLVSEAERRMALRGAKRLQAVIDTHNQEAPLFWRAMASRGWNPTHGGMRFAKAL